MKPADNRQKKSATRLYAVQALFQMEASDTDADTVRNQFLNHRFGAEVDGVEWFDGKTALFEDLLGTAVRNQAKIDQLTDAALVEKWPIDRIDPTIRAARGIRDECALVQRDGGHGHGRLPLQRAVHERRQRRAQRRVRDLQQLQQARRLRVVVHRAWAGR